MTEMRDFDRLARAWLDLMPDEAPDRVIDAVLQAAETTPQVRRPLRVASWRFPPMNRLSYAAIAVVIVAVLAGGAIVLTRSDQNVGPSLRPSPSPSPSSSEPAGANLPPELIGSWFGPNLPLPGLESGAGTVLAFDLSGAQISQSNQQEAVLLSAAGSIVGGKLQVEAVDLGPTGGCRAAQVGTYGYAVSPSGQTLTLTADNDDCAARAAVVVGTWWRIDCRIGQNTCLGLMDAGTYGSQYVRPRLAGADWAPKFGGLTFTVPAGWANSSDWPAVFGLTESTTFEASDNGEGKPILYLNTQVGPAAQGPSRCLGTPEPGIPATPDALVAYLRGIPGLVVSKSHAITVDRLAGTWVDLSVDPATIRPCPDSGPKIIVFLANGTDGGGAYYIGTDGVERVIFLDLGGGELVAVSLEAPDQGTLDAFWTRALPIIQSFHFG